MSKAFTPRTVERLRAVRASGWPAELVGGLVAAGGGDLLDRVAEPLPVAVIAEMLGIPESDRALLRPWSADICGMYELNPSRGDGDAGGAGVGRVLRVPAGADRARAARSPGDDLISALIAAHDEGDRLTEQEMISTCVLLLNAGHEATVNATVNGWWALFRHPEQLAALRADHALLPTAVEELMRYDTPLQLFERWVLDDIEIDGTIDPARLARSRCSSARPTATRPRFADPDTLDLPARTTRTSPSARASTTASAPRWPASNWRRPSARCCAGRPTLRLVGGAGVEAGLRDPGLRGAPWCEISSVPGAPQECLGRCTRPGPGA